MNKEQYSEYLQSEHWKTTRQLILSQYEHCMLCSSQDNLQVHHNNYSNLGKEDFRDLICICQPCHENFHEHRKVESNYKKKKNKDTKKIKNTVIEKPKEIPPLEPVEHKENIKLDFILIETQFYDFMLKLESNISKRACDFLINYLVPMETRSSDELYSKDGFLPSDYLMKISHQELAEFFNVNIEEARDIAKKFTNSVNFFPLDLNSVRGGYYGSQLLISGINRTDYVELLFSGYSAPSLARYQEMYKHEIDTLYESLQFKSNSARNLYLLFKRSLNIGVNSINPETDSLKDILADNQGRYKSLKQIEDEINKALALINNNTELMVTYDLNYVKGKKAEHNFRII